MPIPPIDGCNLVSKHRDRVDSIADLLKAAGEGSSKTKIMYAANMSYGYLIKYLELALNQNLLVFKKQKYILTPKGKTFLDQYLAFQNNKLKAQTLLQELENQRKHLDNLLPPNSNPPVTLFDTKKESETANEIAEFENDTSRISPKQFYLELQQLGLNNTQAFEVASWLNIILSNSPTLYSGKKATTIKACLAYIGGKTYGPPQAFTQNKIATFYHLNFSSSIHKSYKKYLTILKNAKPQLFTNKKI
jgi:predicted transcriptional regulator